MLLVFSGATIKANRSFKKGKPMCYVLRFILILLLVSPAFAAAGNGVVFVATPIPTLDEFGLGGLAALVAGLAGWAIRRNQKKKK